MKDFGARLITPEKDEILHRPTKIANPGASINGMSIWSDESDLLVGDEITEEDLAAVDAEIATIDEELAADSEFDTFSGALRWAAKAREMVTLHFDDGEDLTVDPLTAQSILNAASASEIDHAIQKRKADFYDWLTDIALQEDLNEDIALVFDHDRWKHHISKRHGETQSSRDTKDKDLEYAKQGRKIVGYFNHKVKQGMIHEALTEDELNEFITTRKSKRTSPSAPIR